MTTILPSTWSWVEVDGITSSPSDITDGPFGSNLKTEHYTDAGPCVIRLQNIGDGFFIEEKAHISPEHFASLRKHEVKVGDIVVAMLGSELPRACIVPSTLGLAIVKADCVRVRPDEALVDSHYVSSALNSSVVRYQAKELVHGVGRPRLGLNLFRTLKVPLAPKNEQQRIVEAIDSYLSRLDAAAASLARVEAKLKAYRASVLKAAVEGRLVPTEAALAKQEQRDYEPASVLLDRILGERRRRWEEAELARLTKAGKPPKDDKWKAKYEQPAAPDPSKLPPLPEGWCWATVEQLGVIASGQTPNGVTEMCSPEGDIPWFRVADMNAPGNETYMVYGKDFLTTLQAESVGLHVRPAGTIIFPKRGGAIATNKKRLLHGPSAYDLNTMGVVPEPESADYLWLWFLKLDLGGLSDGSNVPQINNGDIAPLAVPLPPAAEQARIIEGTGLLLSSAEKSAEQVSVNARRVARLRQAVLKWAFEGKLVEQDPRDEPADVLLARIAAERAAAPSPKTRGRRAKSV
ncbi:MAG: restriction endonuclease subunit S [Myxococcales bacterium]|jgi:type I restriction enzyme S subunit|nr:restriction endonuclease subunit S [Myxococcales bacterium]